VCPNTDLTGAHHSMAEKRTGYGLKLSMCAGPPRSGCPMSRAMATVT